MAAAFSASLDLYEEDKAMKIQDVISSGVFKEVTLKFDSETDIDIPEAAKAFNDFATKQSKLFTNPRANLLGNDTFKTEDVTPAKMKPVVIHAKGVTIVPVDQYVILLFDGEKYEIYPLAYRVAKVLRRAFLHSLTFRDYLDFGKYQSIAGDKGDGVRVYNQEAYDTLIFRLEKYLKTAIRHS